MGDVESRYIIVTSGPQHLRITHPGPGSGKAQKILCLKVINYQTQGRRSMLRRNLVISVGFSLILLVSSILPQRLLFRPRQALASDLRVNELNSPGSRQDDIWNSSGPAGGYGACLAISTSDPDVLYACSYGGVYHSTDIGKNWT